MVNKHDEFTIKLIGVVTVSMILVGLFSVIFGMVVAFMEVRDAGPALFVLIMFNLFEFIALLAAYKVFTANIKITSKESLRLLSVSLRRIRKKAHTLTMPSYLTYLMQRITDTVNV